MPPRSARRRQPPPDPLRRRRGAHPRSPAPAGPDFSSLERHLIKITSQIEALQRPDDIEQSIAAFRSELAEIRHAITEAMPRRAIELIENEIRSLSRRIDDNRQSGTDGQALAGIERALCEIREVLRSLTPAEQLAGYDDAIRNLGAKLDLILRANDDPSTVHQLEGAIAALRSIVSNVASNDALARLVRRRPHAVVQGRSARPHRSHGDSFAILEQRIAALTSTLESRERPAASDNSEHLENAMRALSDRIDRMQVGNDSASAFAHLEQRVSYLLERIEASSGSGSGNLGRVEDGLQDILRHLERQHANLVALAESNRQISAPAPWPIDSGLIDMVKRELSDIRFSQSETDRRTQDSLETVHNTLGHVVDRLVDDRRRSARSAHRADRAGRSRSPCRSNRGPRRPAVATPPAMAPQPKPELPNPGRGLRSIFKSLRRPISPPPRANSSPRSRRPRRRRRSRRAPSAKSWSPTLRRRASRSNRICRRIIRSSRARDRPRGCLRPPSASPPRRARSAKFPRGRKSPSAPRASSPPRAAPPRPPPRSRSTRRPPRAASKAAAKAKAGDKPKDGQEPSTITSKIRSLLVGASVVVIVLGTFKMAMTLLDTGSAPPMPAMENSSEPAPSAAAARGRQRQRRRRRRPQRPR